MVLTKQLNGLYKITKLVENNILLFYYKIYTDTIEILEKDFV